VTQIRQSALSPEIKKVQIERWFLQQCRLPVFKIESGFDLAIVVDSVEYPLSFSTGLETTVPRHGPDSSVGNQFLYNMQHVVDALNDALTDASIPLSDCSFQFDGVLFGIISTSGFRSSHTLGFNSNL